MPGGRSFAELLARGVAIAGGVLFVASLAGGVLAYVFPFARVASSPGVAFGDIAIDAALFTLFAFHHSLFARTGIKRWLTAVLPARLERSVYVWISSLLFLWVSLSWRPLPGVFWHIGAPVSLVLNALQIAGIAMSINAARRLDVLTLAGIRQAFGQPSRASGGLLRTGAYGWVRHPIYFAWVLMVWPTPVMTGSRLLFAALSTVYLMLAIPFEERSLRQEFSEYDAYARDVKWKMIPFVY